MGVFKQISDVLQSLVETVTDGEENIHVALRREPISVRIDPDAAAATESNKILYKALYDCRIKSAEYIPDAVVTGHADNYAELDLNSEDGAAGGLTSIDDYSTDSDVTGEGTIAARVGFEWSVDDSDTLDAGEILVLEITKAGTGVQLGGAVVNLVLERL